MKTSITQRSALTALALSVCAFAASAAFAAERVTTSDKLTKTTTTQSAQLPIKKAGRTQSPDGLIIGGSNTTVLPVGPLIEIAPYGTMYIYGTEHDDEVDIDVSDFGPSLTLNVTVTDLETGENDYRILVVASGINEIVVHTYGGDDHVSMYDLGTPVAIPMDVDAGAGDDIVEGGNGPDILFGGPGNDLVVGKRGADFVFGDGGLDEGPDGNDQLAGCMFNNFAAPFSEHQYVWYDNAPDYLEGGGAADDFYIPVQWMLTWPSYSWNYVFEDTIADMNMIEGDLVVASVAATEEAP